MSRSHLESFLERFGLDKNERNVYLALLSLTDARASDIAKKSGIKRPTVYQILEKLKERGLVTSYTSKGIQRFYAENPNALKHILEEQMILFDEMIPELQSVYKNPQLEQKGVRLFKGKEGVKRIYNEALGCKEKIIYTIGSYTRLKEILGPASAFTERRVAQKILSQALRYKHEEESSQYAEDAKKELREVRWLPDEIKIPGMFIMWDDTSAFISSKEEEVGFMIESKNYSTALKSIFAFLWSNKET